MGAFTGTLSYKLFFVQGDLPDDWKTLFLHGIQRWTFRPLTPEDEDEESLGWVPIQRPLQADISYEDFIFNDFINLGFRRDRWSLPNALLRARTEEAEREYKIANEKQKLSKFERDDIKDMVRTQLKNQTIPRMKVIDMSWELSTMRVRFWSQSSTVIELFQEFFEDTFELKLLPANPYIHGLQLDLDDVRLERLATSEPSNFLEGQVGIDY